MLYRCDSIRTKHTTGMCTDLYVTLLLRDRPRPDHQSAGDPRQSQRAVHPPQRDEGVQGRPQQQPRGQEPSRAHRDRPGSGPPPPPHRDRDPRDRDQVGTETWVKGRKKTKQRFSFIFINVHYFDITLCRTHVALSFFLYLLDLDFIHYSNLLHFPHLSIWWMLNANNVADMFF